MKNNTGPVPAAMIMWTIHDAVIDDPQRWLAEINDIRNAGFRGIAALVRCNRYRWDHPRVRAVLAKISDWCRENGLAFWLAPDPRYLSRTCLEASGQGLPVVLFGDQTLARQVPHTETVQNGRFSIRCAHPPRHGHMVHEVAIEYRPAGICRVVAVRHTGAPLQNTDLIDLTEQCDYFYNARDGYVEAFGAFQPPDTDEWRVCAFFLFETCHVDYSNQAHLQVYLSHLDLLRKDVAELDLLIWDEPGYTCVYGALPFSRSLAENFERLTRARLCDEIWKLAFEAQDHSHIRVRQVYYRLLRQTVVEAQELTLSHARRVWGAGLLGGIHDTWHFESADMADRNHGSMDLWQGLANKSGGFVDLGGVQVLSDPQSDYYANLAAMAVIGTSLGRCSAKKFAINNLWTAGGGESDAEQLAAMNHCVDVMAAFGQHWLAHIYGPVGTIGESDRFLGSAPTPGYPNHCTWKGFPEWTHRLEDHFRLTGNHLPMANLLFVYPVETLYAVQPLEANAIAADCFRLLLALIDHHYQVHVVTNEMLAHGEWKNGRFLLNGELYDSLLLPHARIVPERILPLIRSHMQVKQIFAAPEFTDAGETLTDDQMQSFYTVDELLQRLKQVPGLRPVETAAEIWVTFTILDDTQLVTALPYRCGTGCKASIALADGREVTDLVIKSLTTIEFSHHGRPRVRIASHR
ncbi:MAG TPA: hypothetical protein PKN04_04545 [bacterium]|nr:hypothetical protein [bacterium]